MAFEWPGAKPAPQTEPEILPPEGRGEPARSYGEDAQFEPSSGPRRPRPHVGWASAPATYVLVGINCLVYVAMVARGISPSSPTAADLVHWGANYGVDVLARGQWWRLLTAGFVHIGLMHLAVNMWCLWNLGLLGEPLLGPVGLIAAYVLTDIAGNLLSTAIHPFIVGAGASGAIFGLAGVLILLLKAPPLPLPRGEINRLRRSVIWFAVFNFVLGGGLWFFRTPLQVDNMAHLGGFVCGLALGVPLLPKIGSLRPKFVLRSWLAYGGMALALILLARQLAAYAH